jgi:hypothetical protein
MFYAAQALLLTVMFEESIPALSPHSTRWLTTQASCRRNCFSGARRFRRSRRGNDGFTAISEEQARAGIGVGRKFVDEVGFRVAEWLRDQV